MFDERIKYNFGFDKTIYNSDEDYHFEITFQKTIHFIPQIGMQIVNPKELQYSIETVKMVQIGLTPEIEKKRQPVNLMKKADWILDTYTYKGYIQLRDLDLAASKKDEQACDDWFLRTPEDRIIRSYKNSGASIFKWTWNEKLKAYESRMVR